MKRVRSNYPASESAVRKELAARLRDRTGEIENALYAHVSPLGVELVEDGEDPEYLAGRRVAITELVRSALIFFEQVADEPAPPIPLEAAMQARRSARLGVDLGTVLRRYVAGEKLITKFVVDAGEGLPPQMLWKILGTVAPHFDALLEAVIAEYTDELGRTESFQQRRLRRYVDGLLAGHWFAQTPDIGYDLEGWHLGLVVIGPRPEVAVHSLAKAIGRHALVVPREHGVASAWLGGGSKLPIGDVEQVIQARMPADVSVAIGEAREGIDGWRVTHREALAGLQVMLRRPQRVIRGSKVILLAAVLRDEGLVEALRQTYLVPLGDEGDPEQVLRETLRTYFSTGGNAVTSAALLGVNRQTVQRRIRRIEERLGCLLPTCQAELQVALSLDQLPPPEGDDLKHIGSLSAAH